MSFSNFLENELLDHLFGGQSFAPTTLHVGLFLTIPNSEDGLDGIEVSGNGYARAAVACNQTNWPASTNGVISNGAAIVFPAATASWGTINGVGIFDAATGGNLLASVSLQTQRIVNAGEIARFSIGAISITLD